MLFNEHVAFVTLRALSTGVPFADVPDVVQTVFIALWEALTRGSIDLSKPIRGWLREVTFRTARDHLGLARHAREVLDTGTEAADGTPTPEERMQAIDVHKVVNDVLAKLPPEQRIVLVMSDMEEMTMPEIAGALEIPVATGYNRLRIARETFKRAWGRKQATQHAAILPFALWDAKDLLHHARPVPELPAHMVDDLWTKIATTLGPSLVGAAGAAAAGAAAAKTGATLTVKQAIVGALTAALFGAGLHAAFRETFAAPTAPLIQSAPLLATTIGTTTAAATTPAPVTPATQAPSTAASASTTVTVATTAAPTDNDAAERKWLESARDALERGDLPAARAALSRMKSPRFAKEREELRRLVLAYQDGGS
jgi:RNA polymerase sigma-70 factor (ECF subfamily)